MVRVEGSKICPVPFQSQCFDDDLLAFLFFEVFLFTFVTADVASDNKSSKQESKSYTLTHAPLNPRFISFIPVQYQWRQSCHSLHSFVNLLGKTAHQRQDCLDCAACEQLNED